MDRYSAETYGETIADVYDDFYRPFAMSHPMIMRLRELAGAGPALELGIGTGRVALPLSSYGIALHGIDASGSMIKQLRDKPGGMDISVEVGNMADVNVHGHFSLIYVLASTFFALLSQEEQIRCFVNCAKRLEQGGVFLIEAFTPDPAQLTIPANASVHRVEMDGISLEITFVNQLQQRISGNCIFPCTQRKRTCPVELRYAWPSELDLMARIAGMYLDSRQGGWEHEPYVGQSRGHISIYRKSS